MNLRRFPTDAASMSITGAGAGAGAMCLSAGAGAEWIGLASLFTMAAVYGLRVWAATFEVGGQMGGRFARCF
jgi:hypothetical protein